MLEAHAALHQRWAGAGALLQEAQAKSLQLAQIATKRGNRLQVGGFAGGLYFPRGPSAPTSLPSSGLP